MAHCKPLSSREIEAILDLYVNAKWGIKKVSKELGISRDRIRILLKERAIELHTSKTKSYPCCSLYRKSQVKVSPKTQGEDYSIKRLSLTPEYQNWRAMKRRCFDKNHEKYRDYGGRGITVYQPWKEHFHLYYIYLNSTIGLRPNKKYTIDRINNDGNYEPGNIQWLTNQEQTQKTRKNVLTPDKVRYIRQQRDSGNNTIANVAREINVHPQNVWACWHNKTWNNVV